MRIGIGAHANAPSCCYTGTCPHFPGGEGTAMTVVVRFARQAGIVALFVAAALGGTLSGVLFAYSDDLPEVSALDNYTPNTITRVLGHDGALVGEFAVERRVVVRYDEIPLVLRQAILAAEDSGFFDHAGLSISRMMLALLRDVVSS